MTAGNNVAGGGADPRSSGLRRILARAWELTGGDPIQVTGADGPPALTAAAQHIGRVTFAAGEVQGPQPEASWELGDDEAGRLLAFMLVEPGGRPLSLQIWRRSDRALLCYWLSRDETAVRQALEAACAFHGRSADDLP